MEKIKTCCIVLLLVFAGWQCGSPQKAFEIRKIGAIPLQFDEAHSICQVWDLAIDAENRFYLADTRCNTIWVADSSGHFVRQIGTPGQGPGELSEPVSIALRGDTLAVLEGGNSRVSFFRKNGTFLSSFMVQSGLLSGLEMHPVDSILVISESLGMWQHLVYSLNSVRLDSVQIQRHKGIALPVKLSAGNLSQTADGNLLYSPIRQYRVVKFNWQGEILQTFAEPSSLYKAPNLHSPEALMKSRDWALVLLPLQVGDLVLVQWRAQQKLSLPDGSKTSLFFDLYSADGRVLQSAIPSPEFFYAAKGDTLYGVDMDTESGEPIILLYQIVEK